jgi:hypothetical protein
VSFTSLLQRSVSPADMQEERLSHKAGAAHDE